MIEVLLIIAGVLLAIFLVPLLLVVVITGIGIVWFIVMGPIVTLLMGLEALCKWLKAVVLARIG